MVLHTIKIPKNALPSESLQSREQLTQFIIPTAETQKKKKVTIASHLQVTRKDKLIICCMSR